ncbi:MAG: NuoI/complex I 23 kDa subunit family protein [Planctomycetota bacterium]|jgi:NADH-quinone oxidoreductase subunit I
MAVVRWARDIVEGLFTVLVGMKVTIRHFLEKPVTMFYPEERWTLPERFRGLIKVDNTQCLACEACARACPVDCIEIETRKKIEGKGKETVKLIVNYQKCMYCGFCEASCPTGGLWHSHDYENSSETRDEQVIDWMLPENSVKSPKVKVKKKPAPKPKPPAPKPEAAAVPSEPPPPPAPVPAEAEEKEDPKPPESRPE